jgi:acyl-coenzyme A thioesterase PaaI-like protein
MSAAPGKPFKPFYTREGDVFMPTGLSTSPWNRATQNGVALGVVMSHTLNEEVGAAHARLARLTLDILRPAPIGPTRVVWRALHDGRRVRLLQGELEADGVIAARANALLVAPSGPTPEAQSQLPPAISPEQATDETIVPRQTGLETRIVQRGRVDLSAARRPHRVWLRVEAEITPGAPASPVSTAMAAADCGGSSLGPLGAEWNSPNLDITAHFARAPRGIWVQTEAEPMMLGNGVAVINHRLSDRDGEFARAHQTLFFTRRPQGAPA